MDEKAVAATVSFRFCRLAQASAMPPGSNMSFVAMHSSCQELLTARSPAYVKPNAVLNFGALGLNGKVSQRCIRLEFLCK